MNGRHNVIAYLATLAAIVVMSIVAAVICVSVEPDTHLAQIVAALGFISAAVTGLIGVIGTFKAREATPPDGPLSVVVDQPPTSPVPVEAK